MKQGIGLLVYPVKDVARAKAVFTQLLGAEPYVDQPYYVGYRVGDQEVGLDPHGQSAGPIAYRDVGDIERSLKELLGAGAEPLQEVKDVGGGMRIALVKDGNGNVLGLRQSA
jgi:predicted enzyme related to lactoylglutathione lyase